MYKFEKTTNNTGGLFNVLKDGALVAYIRIKYGVVNLYPILDDEIAWGIVLGSWVFDDINKTTLSDEEEKNILYESTVALEEWFEEFAVPEERTADIDTDMPGEWVEVKEDESFI